jgi:hypothetical protein
MLDSLVETHKQCALEVVVEAEESDSDSQKRTMRVSS